MPKGYQEAPGTKYGKLTVLEQSEIRIRNRLSWKCQCDCGNYIDVAGTDLRTGRKVSCGKCVLPSNAIDETGHTYGRLTVIGLSKKPPNKSRNLMWSCLCECGNYTDVSGDDLRKGSTQSCGCLCRETRGQSSLIDEIGNTYGKLTVIDKAPSTDSRTYWKCLCECGNITYALGGTLRSGMKKSCGCLSSYGNFVIEQFLQQHNIPYKSEVTFPSCITNNGGKARFDFGIYNQNNELLFLLEYQGEQHFIQSDKKFGKLQREETDELKRVFCTDNKIKLYEIIYTENILEKLQQILYAENIWREE